MVHSAQERGPGAGSPTSDLIIALGTVLAILLYRLQSTFQSVIEKTETIAQTTTHSIAPYLIIGIPFGIFLSMLLLAVKAYSYHYTPEIISDVTVEDMEQYWREEDGLDFESTPELMVQQLPARQEEPKIEMHIDTEELLSIPLHSYDLLEPEERDILERNGYEIVFGEPVGEKKQSKHLLRTNRLESHEHTFLVSSFAEFLKHYAQNVRIYLTQLPDITCDYNGKKYAFEIETPRRLSGKRDRLKDKAQRNNQDYPDRWWFVVTRGAYAKSFKKYGAVLTRRQLPDFIPSLFSHPSPVYNGKKSGHAGRAATDEKGPKRSPKHCRAGHE